MTDHPDPHDDPFDLGVVPLFPLPNVVLFPRAVLPLHIFEERYKAMTRHALEGDRRIAMALLRPGWEKSYHERPAIEPVVCVGSILAHERLPDGKYNFLLQGMARACIVSEVGCEPYRLARLRRLDEVPADEEELAAQREAMSAAFAHGPLAASVPGRQFERLLATSLSTPDLADLIAFNFVEGVELKQSLLADSDVARRVARTMEALDEVRPVFQSSSIRTFRNPGVN